MNARSDVSSAGSGDNAGLAGRPGSRNSPSLGARNTAPQVSDHPSPEGPVCCSFQGISAWPCPSFSIVDWQMGLLMCIQGCCLPCLQLLLLLFSHCCRVGKAWASVSRDQCSLARISTWMHQKSVHGILMESHHQLMWFHCEQINCIALQDIA